MQETSTTPKYPLYTPSARNFASLMSSDIPLTPSDIDTAYSLFSSDTDGSGITVAVIDAYGSQTITDDFKTFGRMFGLPDNNLEVYYISGSATVNPPGWVLEAHADTQWAYATAPAARIICIFAPNDSIESLFSAVDFAINLGADIISMSWGSDEFIGQARYTERMKNSGKIFIASSGDVGGKVVFPSSSDAVLSVGGTVLHRTRNGSIFARSAWINGGGGSSRYTPIPEWQEIFSGIKEMSGSFRATPDIALNASRAPGYAVYIRDSGGLVSVGGTSIGAPVFAGICARLLQKNPQALNGKTLMQYLYELAGQTEYSEPQYYFNDITVGSNGVYDALVGYDMCTGLGVPIGRQIIGG